MEILHYEERALENTEYSGCTFVKCVFANMTMRNVTFSNCVFEECSLRNVTFRECSMVNGAFLKCVLMGLDWSVMRRHGTRLSVLWKMPSCAVRYNTFVNMKMGKMDFSGSSLHDCYFQECECKQADFRACDLENTVFQNCNLSKADFRDARNYRINVLNNTVAKAKFSQPDVMGLLCGFDIVIEP
ncbi:MAG: pentapeptide repeat-containing protein [Planctomycetota bacterium]|nr:pentapeptide repeat-containing protein [Planctomycetota bacterium]